jgi:hypothetical protein
MPYLVTIGDSVHWGQGLRREHTFSHLVAAALRRSHPGLVEHMLAHSGAVIGVGAAIDRPSVNGEVPVGQPTIIDQLTGYTESAQEALVVLVNGGINDIDVRNVINPYLPIDALRTLIEEHCYDSMRALLAATLARFPLPATSIVVTPYFPVFSTKSTPFRIPRFMVVQGLQPEPPPTMRVETFFDRIVDRCLVFWRESTDCLQRAVDETNAALTAPRIILVDPGFTEDNAMFAGDPWLWGLNNDLSPQDEVVDARHGVCDLAIPWFDGFAREQCYRASAGHPNVKGAQRYAEVILQAIR